MPLRRARLLGVVASTALLALAGSTAAGATSTDLGLPWPDGEYTVILEGSRSVSGGDSSGSGSGAGSLTGTVDLVVGPGEEPVFVAYLYSLSGSGVSAGGITGEGDLDITITGAAMAEEGRVRIEREEAVAQFSGVVIGGVVVPNALPPIVTTLNDTLPLVARSRSCGFVEGEWAGALTGLAAVAAAAPGFSADSGEARFIAVSRAVGGSSPSEFVGSLRRSIDTLTDATASVRAGTLSALEAVDVLRSQTIEAELLVADLTLPECPDLGDYGLGTSAALLALLDAIRESVAASREPLDTPVIADLVEAAVRSGLASADPDLADALADLVAEAAVGADGDATILYPLILAAVALGDLVLADSLADAL